MSASPRPNIAIIDEEISKTIFGAYPSKRPQYLGDQDVVRDWTMICAGWKWYGEKRISLVSRLDDMKRFKKDPFDDFVIVKKLHDIISEADAIAGHCITRFDYPKFVERAMCHGLDPLPKPRMLDTYLMAKQCGFSYNSLRYLSKRLRTKEKLDNRGNEMWMEIATNPNKANISECVTYCRGDIQPVEDLLDKFLPWVGASYGINHNLFRGDGVTCCPKCGSLDYKKDGTRGAYQNFTIVGRYQRYQCLNKEKKCGYYFMDGKRIKGSRYK